MCVQLAWRRSAPSFSCAGQKVRPQTMHEVPQIMAKPRDDIVGCVDVREDGAVAQANNPVQPRGAGPYYSCHHDDSVESCERCGAWWKWDCKLCQACREASTKEFKLRRALMEGVTTGWQSCQQPAHCRHSCTEKLTSRRCPGEDCGLFICGGCMVVCACGYTGCFYCFEMDHLKADGTECRNCYVD